MLSNSLHLVSHKSLQRKRPASCQLAIQTQTLEHAQRQPQNMQEILLRTHLRRLNYETTYSEPGGLEKYIPGQIPGLRYSRQSCRDHKATLRRKPQ